MKRNASQGPTAGGGGDAVAPGAFSLDVIPEPGAGADGQKGRRRERMPSEDMTGAEPGQSHPCGRVDGADPTATASTDREKQESPAEPVEARRPSDAELIAAHVARHGVTRCPPGHAWGSFRADLPALYARLTPGGGA